MMRIFVAGCLVLAAGALERPAASLFDEDVVRSVLTKYAEPLAREWNMSIALAFFSPTLLPNTPLVAVAAGKTNGGLLIKPSTLPRAAEPEDLYVWGSITKMFTAPAGEPGARVAGTGADAQLVWCLGCSAAASGARCRQAR